MTIKWASFAHALDLIPPEVEHEMLSALCWDLHTHQLFSGHGLRPVGDLVDGIVWVEVSQAAVSAHYGNGIKKNGVPGSETIPAVA